MMGTTKIKKTMGETVFDIFNYIFLSLLALVTLAPYLHVVAGSFSDKISLVNMEVTLWPKGFQLDNYQMVIKNVLFWFSFRNTVIVTIIGTLVNMLLAMLTAYPLSKNYIAGRKIFMTLVIITMVFMPPMIPVYLVVKQFNLLNTFWALIIPNALITFNMILCMTYFKSIPEELFEAARIDGMHEFKILFRIAIPVSIPMLLTLTMFHAVTHWNSYYYALLYITDQRRKPLQAYLFSIISQFSKSGMENIDGMLATSDITPEGLKMASIVTATIPIMLMYPFIQKHFIKGVMVGSVKE